MTGLLSSVSGQFTRAIILGALFPAAIFVLLWLVVVAPLLPPGFALPAPQVLGEERSVVSLTVATLVVAVLLFNLDVPLMQLYEGYPWERSWLGRRKKRAHRARREEERKRAEMIFELTTPAYGRTAGYGRLVAERSRVRRRLPENYPDRDDLVLPTRLGNVLRAFERYPSVQYEIDAIYFWPRLAAVIPDAYAKALDDARTSFVFLLSLSFLSGVLALATLAAGLVYLPPSPLARVFVPALALAAAAAWLYRLSLGPAHTWGTFVKGAFDLYRWDLLARLGYQQRPRTRVEERALWSRVTQQVIFGDQRIDVRTRRPRVDYADPPPAPPTTALAEPADARLEVTRGVGGRGPQGRTRVVVRVENTDPERRTAQDVVVSETLPPGTEYAWDSARAAGRPVRVAGTNPYRFHLGDLPFGAQVVLTYSAFPAEPDQGG